MSVDPPATPPDDDAINFDNGPDQDTATVPEKPANVHLDVIRESLRPTPLKEKEELVDLARRSLRLGEKDLRKEPGIIRKKPDGSYVRIVQLPARGEPMPDDPEKKKTSGVMVIPSDKFSYFQQQDMQRGYTTNSLFLKHQGLSPSLEEMGAEDALRASLIGRSDDRTKEGEQTDFAKRFLEEMRERHKEEKKLFEEREKERAAKKDDGSSQKRDSF